MRGPWLGPAGPSPALAAAGLLCGFIACTIPGPMGNRFFFALARARLLLSASRIAGAPFMGAAMLAAIFAPAGVPNGLVVSAPHDASRIAPGARGERLGPRRAADGAFWERARAQLVGWGGKLSAASPREPNPSG